MNTNNNIEVSRETIVLLGKEFEFASGVRATVASKLMQESAFEDSCALFEYVEEAIGSAYLFESYDDPLNTRGGELVLGQGCPFPSLDAYIALEQHYGDQWLALALADYAAHHGSLSLRSDPQGSAEALIERAKGRTAEARLSWLGNELGKVTQRLVGLSGQIHEARVA